MKFSLSLSDLPEPGAPWLELKRTSEATPEYSALIGSELVFRVKVSDDFFVTPQDMKELYADTDEIEYREHVLDLKNGDHALAQAWRHKNSTNKKAALWVIGRGDGFTHAHVAKELFLGKGVDLYVVNWRNNGRNLNRGFIDNPHHNSHNPVGDVDVYNEEVGLTMDLIKDSGPYETVLGYAHSTGGAILLNYVIAKGDDQFDAFLFNSPFLDWAHAGFFGELALHHVPRLLKNSSNYIDPGKTPDDLKATPIMYLGKEIIAQTWGCQSIHSIYYSEWADRNKYEAALTVGFIRACNSAFKKINCHKGPIISKPILVMTSLSDDVLDASEVTALSKHANEDRQIIQYRYNAHDVFESSDPEDSMAAIADAKTFLEKNVYG
jgi:alpha-beta hydrolase superfamily lysophospholipase